METLNGYVRLVSPGKSGHTDEGIAAKTNHRCGARDWICRDGGIFQSVPESSRQDRQFVGSARSSGKEQDLQSTGNAFLPHCRRAANAGKPAGQKSADPEWQQFDAFRYVYFRIYAPYSSTRLVDSYHALIAWLAARGTDVRDIVVVIGMSLDDPSITPSENCRYDLGAAFPREQKPGRILGEIVRSRGKRRVESASLSPRKQSECDAAGLSIRDF